MFLICMRVLLRFHFGMCTETMISSLPSTYCKITTQAIGLDDSQISARFVYDFDRTYIAHKKKLAETYNYFKRVYTIVSRKRDHYGLSTHLPVLP